MNTRRQSWLDWVNGHRLAIAGVVVVLALAALLTRRRAPDEEEPNPVVTVQTGTAVIKPLVVRINALGVVQARPGHVAEISAPEAARVMSVYVAVGDQVRAGQPLVQLDRAVFTAKRVEAEAGLAAADRAFQRQQRLLSEGIVARKDVETAAAEAARARAELEQARRTESLATLRSPINGIVVVLNAALSQPVEVGQEVVEVVDPRALEVRFHLSPADAGHITPGSKVELTSGDEAQHVQVGAGTITGVSAALDSASGAVTVRATVTTPARALTVGETLNGAILLESRRSSVIVPAESLVPIGETTVVYVVDANHIAHATRVVTGSRSDTEVEIVSGLNGGEIVITKGAYGVTDGAHVVNGQVR